MPENEAIRRLMEQQLKEFKSFLKKFKEKDDALEKIFESGKEPTEAQTKEFEMLKEDYQDFLNYFKNCDYNLWGSDDWTPFTVAQELVRETY